MIFTNAYLPNSLFPSFARITIPHLEMTEGGAAVVGTGFCNRGSKLLQKRTCKAFLSVPGSRASGGALGGGTPQKHFLKNGAIDMNFSLYFHDFRIGNFVVF